MTKDEPKFIADWIREAAQPSNLATISVMHSDAIRYGKHIDYYSKPCYMGMKLRKSLNTMYKLYVNYRTSDDTFGLDSKLEASNIKTAFTKSWLKDNWSEYDAYNNAGLLEFEEVNIEQNYKSDP